MVHHMRWMRWHCWQHGRGRGSWGELNEWTKPKSYINSCHDVSCGLREWGHKSRWFSGNSHCRSSTSALGSESWGHRRPISSTQCQRHGSCGWCSISNSSRGSSVWSPWKKKEIIVLRRVNKSQGGVDWRIEVRVCDSTACGRGHLAHVDTCIALHFHPMHEVQRTSRQTLQLQCHLLDKQDGHWDPPEPIARNQHRFWNCLDAQLMHGWWGMLGPMRVQGCSLTQN